MLSPYPPYFTIREPQATVNVAGKQPPVCSNLLT